MLVWPVIFGPGRSGLAFGRAATLFQTASTNASGTGALPWACAVPLALALMIVCFASRSEFPSTTQTA
jgi:hypothetical protein